jgi:hypothetical protein
LRVMSDGSHAAEIETCGSGLHLHPFRRQP